MQLEHYYIDVSEFVLTQCQILKLTSLLIPEVDIFEQESVSEHYTLTPNSYPIFNPIILTPQLAGSQIGDESFDYFELQPKAQLQLCEQGSSENIAEKQFGDCFNSATNFSSFPNTKPSNPQITSQQVTIKKLDNEESMRQNCLTSFEETYFNKGSSHKSWWEEPKYLKVMRYLQKKERRNWSNKFSYKCRRTVAGIRLRIKGKFIARSQAEKILESSLIDLSNDQIKQKLSVLSKKVPLI